MAPGSKSAGAVDLPEIQLKYPDLEAFARASRKTFKIGRMSLKSRKIFKVGSRLVLKFVIGDLGDPVEVIGQIIDVVPPKEGKKATYGIRFLNFTEKKLQKLLKSQSEPAAPPEEKKAPRPKVAKPKAPPPSKPIAPEAPSPEPRPEIQDEETEVFTIEAVGESEHMNFEERPEGAEPEAAPPYEQPPLPPQESEAEAGAEEEPDIGIEPAEPEEAVSDEPSPPVEAGEEPAPAPPDEEEAPEPEEAVSAEPAPPAEAEEEPEPAPPEEAESAEPEEAVGEESVPPSEVEEDTEPMPSIEDDEEALEGAPLEPEPSLPEGLDDEPEPMPGLEEEEEEEEEEFLEAPRADSEPAPAEGSEFMERESIETPSLGLPSEPEEPIPVEGKAPEPEAEAEEPRREAVIKPMSPAEYHALSEFLIKFTRSLAQPQAAEGKEAGPAMKSLYGDFKNIMQGRDEIGVFIRVGPTGKDFVLEGTDTEPKSIKSVFNRNASADLVIKMADLFERKGLLGLTLRRYSTEDAFQSFVKLISEFSGERGAIDDLVRSLVKSGAYHLTPIFLRDQIPGSHDINWRIALTLNRLSGEIRRLIMVADAIQEDPRALFTLRVEDALKPIQNPGLLAELLLCCNLVIAGQTEFSEADLQSEIVFALPLDKLVATCELLAYNFEEIFSALKSKPDDEGLREREELIRKTLRRAMARVSFEAPEKGMKILRHLYGNKVLGYDELPEVLRGRIDAERSADEFEKDPRHEIDYFEKEARASEYEKKARQMAHLVIELLRRDKADLADLAFNVLVNHRTQKTPPFPERPRLAKGAMMVFAERDSIPVILEKLSSGDKGERELAASLFYAAGDDAVPALLDLLEGSEDRSIRRMVCDILIRLGDKIGPRLVEKLFSEDTPWYLARNLVMVLAEMGSPIFLKDIDQFMNHEHPRVREESLGYFVKANKAKGAEGEDTEPKLVRSLHDADLNVRRRAVQLLGQLSRVSDFSLQGLVWLMEKKSEPEPTKEEEHLFVQVSDLLGKTSNRRLPEGRTVEDALLKILESESKGLMGRIVGSKGRTPRMRAALIEVLGKIGTDKSRKPLARASKDKDTTVKKAAQTAIARLKKKEKGG